MRPICVHHQVEETREVMEAEMRTQLRRQAAAHTDHLRDVLKVQEQELRSEAEEASISILNIPSTVTHNHSQTSFILKSRR